MNRRNFILGLGTAATLSGAASVTGAAINDTVSPSANFQVIADQNLDVQRNRNINTAGNGEILNSTGDNYVNSTVDYVDPEGTFSGANATDSGAGDIGGPRLTVDNGTDGNLNMALASPNDASIDANLNDSVGGGTTDDPYGGSDTAPLEVVNQGGSAVEVTVNYDYGDDVGTNSLDQEDVAQLFTFSIPDSESSDGASGGQISPGTTTPGSEGDADGNTATVGSGDVAYVNFNINYSEEIESAIASAAGSDFGFGSDSTSAVDLLDSVEFGTTGNA